MEKILSKSELAERFGGAKSDDPVLGEITLAELSDDLFQKVVGEHNRKLDMIAEKLPDDRHHLRHRIAFLRIPAFESFLGILADRDRKVAVDAHLRRARFENYKKWLKKEHRFLWENFLDQRFPFRLASGDCHTYLIGKTGSGKSEVIKLLCMLSQEQNRQKRCRVIIDPAGDLAGEIARQKFFRTGPEHLVYIDPFLDGSRTERFPCLNPFDLCGRKTNRNQVATLAEQLCGVFVSILRGDVSLSLQMETLLIPCLTVLIKRPDSTLFDLLRFMNEEHNADLLELGRQSANEAHRMFFSRLFDSRNFNPTKISIATKTQSLLNNRIFASLIARPHSTLDLRGAIESGKTIVVNCAKGKLGDQTSEAFGRFVVAMVQSVALSRSADERVPIDLMIDECQNFISEDIKLILTEARKFGLNLTLSQQVLGQDMPERLTKIVLGNTTQQIIGNSGRHSREMMAREMNTTAEMMVGLKTGQFVVKTGNNVAMRVRIRSDYVKNKNAMRRSEWKQVRATMSESYYSGLPVKCQIPKATEVAESAPRKPLPKTETNPSEKHPKAPRKTVEPETAKPKFESSSDDIFSDI